MTSSQPSVSPLRQRMIDDMRMRHACPEDASPLPAHRPRVRPIPRALA